MHGQPSRRGYHNKQWAGKMMVIGLQPSSTGAVGGKETGQCMSHYIVPGAGYAVVCAELLATGFKLQWQSTPHGNASKPPSSHGKFTCPRCEEIYRAKPTGEGWICPYCYDADGSIIRAVLADKPSDIGASADSTIPIHPGS
jgi:hypothetical protein